MSLMSKKIWPTLQKLAKQKWFDKNEVKKQAYFYAFAKENKNILQIISVFAKE
jgi:glutamine synthetase adenylyltransferase